MTRKALLLVVSSSGILIAGSAHALPEGWYSLGPDIPYECHGNHVAADSATPIGRHRYSGAQDIRVCQRLCDSTPGCTAFSFERRIWEDSTGRYAYTDCTLYGGARVSAEPMSDRGRFEWGAVCYRTSKWDKHWQMERRRELRIHQDIFRPGQPVPQPANPNKP